MPLAEATNVPKLPPTMAQKRRGKNWGKLLNRQRLTTFSISIPCRIPHLEMLSLVLHPFPYSLIDLLFFYLKTVFQVISRSLPSPKFMIRRPSHRTPQCMSWEKPTRAHVTAQQDSSFCSRSLRKMPKKEGHLALPGIGEKPPWEEGVMDMMSATGL